MSDRIEKRVVLRAPLARVWAAISDAQQFGAWFGVRFDGPFIAGAKMIGTVTPTTVDAEVGRSQAKYAGAKFELVVDAIEPMRTFSFRWHPFAIDPAVDYSREPMTLVVFALAEVAGGTELVITETGFDQIPAHRRAAAFTANEGGWAAQARLVEKYVAP